MSKITFLVSGGGGTLRFLGACIAQYELSLEVCSVVADRDCKAVEYAQHKNIAASVLDFDADGWDRLNEILTKQKPDLVVTTFHRIIPDTTLRIAPNRFINVHYSLLPAFKGYIGMKTVRQAKLQGVRIIGATCHVVDSDVDSGPIVAQAAVPVDWNKDIESIYDQVFRIACIVLLNSLFLKLQLNREDSCDRSSGACPAFIKNALCSPDLQFSVEMLDETFWERVKGQNIL